MSPSEEAGQCRAERAFAPKPSTHSQNKNPAEFGRGSLTRFIFTRVFDGRFLRCRWLLMPYLQPRVYPENAVRQQLKQANFLSNKIAARRGIRLAGRPLET